LLIIINWVKITVEFLLEDAYCLITIIRGILWSGILLQIISREIKIDLYRPGCWWSFFIVKIIPKKEWKYV